MTRKITKNQILRWFFQDLDPTWALSICNKNPLQDELLQASYNSSIQNYLKSNIQQILVVASKETSVKTPTRKFSFRKMRSKTQHIYHEWTPENVFKEIVFLSINEKREMNIM